MIMADMWWRDERKQSGQNDQRVFARCCLVEGVSPDTVVNWTGLSANEVEAIICELEVDWA